MRSWLPGALQLPELHFQRPLWLWALLLLPLLWLFWRRRRQQGWRDAVDAHLLPRLLEPARGRAGLRLAGVSLAVGLAVVALAGPGWRQEQRQQWQARAPLVIALDLSSSSLASDLPPSRLAQARAKIATLLRERKGGEVGLVAWADDAYTVAPLTADAGNIALFLDALAPDVMPVDGHRPERAITHAATLLHQAGFEQGDILLVTDSVDASAQAIAGAVAGQGYRISALGLGTRAGAVYRDGAGATQTARLDEASLRELAAAGGGRYATLTVDDADLRALGVLDPAAAADAGHAGGQRVWLDQGYWLLLPLLLLAALAFRRGAGVLAVLPLAMMLSLPLTAHAAEADGAGALWRRPDQQAQARISKGVDAYRQGDFAAAEHDFGAAGARGAEAQYNLGNALARQGRYDEAIAAYDRALAQSPGMEDAIANRRVVDAARRQQPPQGGKGGQNRPQQGQSQPRDGSPQDSAESPSDGGAGQQPPDDAQQQDGKDDGKADAPPPQAEDAQARERQEQADREQRERMQQALQQGQDPRADPARQASPDGEDAQTREQRQAREAWLRRVPDDPGGLLRAKFRLEYERRQKEGR
ncbi:MAG: VWA domain-containing protein [Pseudoxanthomonas sp.]|nr:VWA domain-containing protein [Pseudoxanthomonas sp.]